MTPDPQVPDLDAIQKYCDAASEGPWLASEKHGRDTVWFDVEADDAIGTELFNLEVCYIGHIGDQNYKQRVADMRFIAKSRADLPAVVRECRELRIRLAVAERDTVRLNWREAHPNHGFGLYSDGKWADGRGGSHDTYRQALDAAALRSETKEDGNGKA